MSGVNYLGLSGGPLVEFCSTHGTCSVTDRNDGIEIEVPDAAANLPTSIEQKFTWITNCIRKLASEGDDSRS